MTEAVERIRELEAQKNRHEAKVNMIKNSEAYEALTKQLNELREKQVAMIPENEIESELYEARKRMVESLKAGVTYDDVVPKYKTKKEVNQTMVMEAIGGDFGTYQELSVITQKSLKDFAKTQAGLKGVLNNCIQVVGREVVDFTVVHDEYVE